MSLTKKNGIMVAFRKQMLEHVWIPKWMMPLLNSPAARWIRDSLLRPWKRTTVLILVYAVLSKSVRVYRRSTWVPRYDTYAEEEFRAQRFPSIQQRVQLYMSNWYLPPCPGSEAPYIAYTRKEKPRDNLSREQAILNSSERLLYYELQVIHGENENPHHPNPIMVVTHQVEIGRIFYADLLPLQNCSQQMNWSIHFYCSDTLQSIWEEVAGPGALEWNYEDRPPLLLQFSDETESLIGLNISHPARVGAHPPVPHFKKIRHALSKNDLDRWVRRSVLFTDQEDDDDDVTNLRCDDASLRSPPTGMDYLQPIVWLLNEDRHFEYAKTLRRYDRPWKDKMDRAVFRGALTGLQYDPHNSDGYNCYQLLRCRLVQEYYHSPLVDARLTDTMGKVPDLLHGMNLTGDHLWKEDILAYKGIIVLEGNDVASGLKWAMVSNSVVLMPPPTFTSWMMEELLEPWVHYIPLAPDLLNVETQVRWMLEHDAEAQRIAHRARLWILDLYFHPAADADRRRINQEILQRYQAHFRAATVEEDAL